MLRSQKITKYDICLPQESATQILNEWFDLESIQILDANQNNLSQKVLFQNEIREISILLKDLEYFKEEIKSKNIKIKTCENLPTFLKSLQEHLKDQNVTFQELLLDIKQKIKNKTQTYQEQIQILRKTQNKEIQILAQCALQQKFNPKKNTIFQSIQGYLDTQDVQRLERLLFRATKNNISIQFSPIPQSLQNLMSDKNKIKDFQIFYGLFPSSKQSYLEQKVKRIFKTFDCHLYEDLPEQSFLQTQLNQVQQIESFSQQTINEVLTFFYQQNEIGDISNLSFFENILNKERVIQYQLSFFRSENPLYKSQIFIPDSEFQTIKQQMKKYPYELVVSKEQNNLPTLITNQRFFAPFQELVNSYGVPRYQEINPGVFAIICFPFLFGVMFGDIAHALCFLAFVYFLYQEKDQKVKYQDKNYNQIQEENKIEKLEQQGVTDWVRESLQAYKGLFLMMGLFSLFCGIIYNDFAGTAFWLSSCYTDNGVKSHSCEYIIGIDPIWHKARNSINFTNSFKMKLAVILGMFQMVLGLCLKGFNFYYFKEKIKILTVFLPQLVFFMSIFGYMIFLIVVKWCLQTEGSPGIVKTLIDMVMKKGLANNSLYADEEIQTNVQQFLLFLAFISILALFFLEPLIDYFSKNDQKSHRKIAKKEDAQEIFVHKLIDNIEFLLGSISNTASYLRLWALSLAHQQLSQVLFENMIKGAVESGNPIRMFISFFIFGTSTAGVILSMDLMECFLHSIRLQWVEFQGKFYHADGELFQPIGIQLLLP